MIRWGGGVIKGTPPGQQAYTTPGSYSFVVPAGVTSICAVCVGGGASGRGFGVVSTHGYGGMAGALAYVNNISVTPGETLTVVVGAGGASQASEGGASNAGEDSRLHRSGTDLCRAGGGTNSSGGVPVVGTGGNGGVLGFSGRGYSSVQGVRYGGGGGGGAGGYSGSGGSGGNGDDTLDGSTGPTAGTAGAGGGGGGGGGGGYVNDTGSNIYGVKAGGRGGGVGILGAGSNGTAGAAGSAEQAGDIGGNGSSGGYGYGGAGPQVTRDNIGNTFGLPSGAGGGGAVRIIWGAGRAYPSTNTGDV